MRCGHGWANHAPWGRVAPSMHDGADDGAAADASATVESSWGLGATYVTSAGDTAVTIGAGYSDSDFKDSDAAKPTANNGFHIGFSAVTGNLTVAAGYANGDKVIDNTTSEEQEVVDNTVTKVGIK